MMISDEHLIQVTRGTKYYNNWYYFIKIWCSLVYFVGNWEFEFIWFKLNLNRIRFEWTRQPAPISVWTWLKDQGSRSNLSNQGFRLTEHSKWRLSVNTTYWLMMEKQKAWSKGPYSCSRLSLWNSKFSCAPIHEKSATLHSINRTPRPPSSLIKPTLNSLQASLSLSFCSP